MGRQSAIEFLALRVRQLRKRLFIHDPVPHGLNEPDSLIDGQVLDFSKNSWQVHSRLQ